MFLIIIPSVWKHLFPKDDILVVLFFVIFNNEHMWALFTLEIDVKDCWKDNRVNLKMLRATDIFYFKLIP